MLFDYVIFILLFLFFCLFEWHIFCYLSVFIQSMISWLRLYNLTSVVYLFVCFSLLYHTLSCGMFTLINWVLFFIFLWFDDIRLNYLIFHFFAVIFFLWVQFSYIDSTNWQLIFVLAHIFVSERATVWNISLCYVFSPNDEHQFSGSRPVKLCSDQ